MFFGSKYARVRRERRRGRVLDALVDREDRHVAGAAEPAVVEQRLQVAQDLRRAVGAGEDAIDEVRAREVEVLVGDGLRLVREEGSASSPSRLWMSTFVSMSVRRLPCRWRSCGVPGDLPGEPRARLR